MATCLAQGASLAALCFTAEAHAQTVPTCASLPNTVLVAGSSAVKPFVAEVAKAYDALTGDDKVTVVYLSQGSCVGVGYFAEGATTQSTTGTATIWTGGAEGTCTLEATPGTDVDIGVSDVWPSTCGKTLAHDAQEFHGPIQSMTMVKAKTSTALPNAITYKVAYAIFNSAGTGAASTPWPDPADYVVRNNASGTQLMIGSVIGIPSGNFRGINAGSSGNVVAGVPATAPWNDAQIPPVAHTTDPTKTIGIVASDAADKARGTLSVLAYKHKGQTKAYWPDSASDKFDKQNVRDGHYMIWGPLHMIANVTDGAFASPLAQKVIETLSGAAKPPTGLDLIKVEAKGYVVPDCAMKVTRTTEGGDLACYLPPTVCECKFLFEATGTAPSRCTTCDTDEDCKNVSGTKTCSYGYCEVR